LSGPFPHLHVRSGFSYGFGTATPEELVWAAAAAGGNALALTNRDGLCGMPRFLRACADSPSQARPDIPPVPTAALRVPPYPSKKAS
jgi:DNA polymerase III alpha subunit